MNTGSLKACRPSAILHRLGSLQWHAKQCVSQPVRAADLHHVMGHDRSPDKVD